MGVKSNLGLKLRTWMVDHTLRWIIFFGNSVAAFCQTFGRIRCTAMYCGGAVPIIKFTIPAMHWDWACSNGFNALYTTFRYTSRIEHSWEKQGCTAVHCTTVHYAVQCNVALSSKGGWSEGPRNGNKVFSRSAEGGKTTQEDPPFFLVMLMMMMMMVLVLVVMMVMIVVVILAVML